MPQLILPLAETRKMFGQWQVFSASKLIQLYECPLAFCFRYFLKPEVLQTPLTVFGSAMHYMFQRFFAVNYKSAKSFAGAWINYWLGICEGRHGTHGFNSDPIAINFRDPEQANQLLAYGITLTKDFYRANSRYRQGPLHPQTEVSFHVTFREYALRGSMDRLQPLGGAEAGLEEIWDYKPRLPEKANLRDDVQLTMYDLAYRLKYQREPAGMRIYNYKTGKKTERVRPRQEKYFDELYDWLKQAHAYLFGVLFWSAYGYLPAGFQFSEFRDFSSTDVERGIFTPRWFPNANRCKICSYYKQCEQWRKKERHTSVTDELFRVLEGKKRQASYEQLELFVQERVG